MDTPSTLATTVPMEKDAIITKGEILVKGVHFKYPSRETKVLDDINFIVPPCQTIALVGASGSGKSTIVSLIERFYDVDDGAILIDGQNLNTFQTKSLRRQIAVVSQEPALFQTSIWNNIIYGFSDILDCSPAHEIKQKVVEAASMANIHTYIMELPDQYQTLVGERGVLLSHGQKQRIAIARALLLNPKILILDEATSALDNQSERIVQEALERLMTGRTCLVIAHRLSTIVNADCIHVIDHGTVVESGTHKELEALGGAYSKLLNAQ